MTEENISWDEATSSGNFVTVKPDQEVKLVLTNWKFEKRPKESKIAPGEVEFIADVLEENGEAVEDKKFTTTSRRLKSRLKPFFENVPQNDTSVKVKVSILRVGEQFNTNYSVKSFD